MTAGVEFEHRWWHHTLIWVTIILAGGLGSVTTYAALFARPYDKGQWIPLVGLIIASWAFFVHYLRVRQTPQNRFSATASGLTVRSGPESSFIPWKQIVEVKKASSFTGMGFIRAGEPPAVYRFCNWLGEANDLAEFAIERCIEEHGA